MRTAHPTRQEPTAQRGETLLAVSSLCVSYGGIDALKGISLEVKRGEIVAMIGANGAGKTTTLKTLARLLRPTRGTMTYDGHDLGALETEDVVELGVSLVNQHAVERKRIGNGVGA